MSATVTTEWGLRHPATGYVRWCVNRIEAEAMKSGRIINGRRDDWAQHELVKRTRTLTLGEPEVVDG